MRGTVNITPDETGTADYTVLLLSRINSAKRFDGFKIVEVCVSHNNIVSPWALLGFNS